MKILAVEFSSRQRSVAVVQAAEKARDYSASEVVETGERGTNAFAMIEEALRQAGIEREAIEVMAVGLGPGSYTGVRMAIAIAQGWQIATGVKLLGISSADCIAAQAHLEGICGNTRVILDAQRGEFYIADYEITAEAWHPVSPLRLGARTEVVSAGDSPTLGIGPDAGLFAGGRVIFPSAETLGRLALQRTDYLSGDQLEPIYLRQTQFVKAPPPRILPS
jgi:tRNA threonylcarbamoyladenosine biosynthesis protein TsaB